MDHGSFELADFLNYAQFFWDSLHKCNGLTEQQQPTTTTQTTDHEVEQRPAASQLRCYHRSETVSSPAIHHSYHHSIIISTIQWWMGKPER